MKLYIYIYIYVYMKLDYIYMKLENFFRFVFRNMAGEKTGNYLPEVT